MKFKINSKYKPAGDPVKQFAANYHGVNQPSVVKFYEI